MIYILVVRILIIKLFYLLRRQSFSFQIMSETVYKYICEILKILCPEGGVFDSSFCPGGGLHNDCPGGGILPPSNRVPGNGFG